MAYMYTISYLSPTDGLLLHILGNFKVNEIIFLAYLANLSHSRMEWRLSVLLLRVALFDWKETDIPFIEHARYFPYCPYIRCVKRHALIRNQHPE